jgi:hypothetical protein
VYWQGSLAVNQEREIEYTLKAVAPISQSIKAKVDYNNTLDIVSVYTTALAFDIDPFLNYYQTIPSGDFYPGKLINYTFNLSNTYDGSVEILSLRLVLPDAISVYTKPSNFQDIGNNTLEYTGRISSNTSRKWVFKFESKKTGAYAIQPIISYKKDVVTQEVIQETDLVIKNKEINIYSETTNNEEIEAQRLYRMKIYIQNTNPYASVKNIEVKAESNLTFFLDERIEEINKSLTSKVYDISFITPNVENTRSFPVVVEAEYETEYGEKFSKRLRFNVKIIKRKTVTITHEVSRNSLQGGDTASIVVKLKNDAQLDLINISVGDDVSDDLSPIGITSSKSDITKGNTVSAYTYTITAPYLAQRKTYVINTSLRYLDGDSLVKNSKTVSITVEPKVYDLSFNKVLLESDIYTGELVGVKYTLKNNDDHGIYNITIIKPTQQLVDVSSENLSIPSLEPGEEWTNQDEKIRLKKNISTTISYSVAVFKDKYGIAYEKRSNTMSVKPSYSRSQYPLYLINKSFEDNNTIINVVNLGDSSSSVTLVDNDNVYSFNLGAYAKHLITIPYFSQGRSISTYTINTISFGSYSNMLTSQSTTTTTTTTKITSTTMQKTQTTTTTTLQKESQKNETKKATVVKSEPKKKKGGFSIFIDKLKNLLSFMNLKKG